LSTITPENFDQFHNTESKITDREAMLRGDWPDTNCGYCRGIEQEGGVSDRMRHLDMPRISPPELDADATATQVDPTVIDVLFSNTCNLACLYCSPRLSSSINQENIKHGAFQKLGVRLEPHQNQYRDLAPSFWKWFETGFPKLRRLHVLGGEPLLMREFQELLDRIWQQPNPDCDLNVVTNLMIPRSRLESYVEQWKQLILNERLRRIDVSASIDCWGPEQEYVRWGIDLKQWQENFEYLCQQPWLKLHISQTITPLTLPSMPELLRRLAEWRKQRHIGHWFSDASPNPEYLKINILGGDVFEDRWQEILGLMPQDTDENRLAWANMHGIYLKSRSTGPVPEQIRNLLVYLDEKDRRRGTNWRELFPWLEQFTTYLDEAKNVA
jgi:hypothetical protein